MTTSEWASAGFRLFISSTFRDFKAERDALHERVFPALTELCTRRGMEFQVVDLRWGISEAAALEHATVNICLKEIARCKQAGNLPNFLFLLGDRYGWRPLPETIPGDEFDAIAEQLRAAGAWVKPARALLEHWYPVDGNAVPPVRHLRLRSGALRTTERWASVEAILRRTLDDAATALDLPQHRRLALTGSATEQEIGAGVLDDPTAPQSVIGLFRSVRGLPSDRRASDYLDIVPSGEVDGNARRQLRELKARLRRVLPRSHRCSYSAHWTDAGISTDHLPELCEDVRRLLERAIEAGARKRERIELRVAEDTANREFVRQRVAHFTGRTAYLQRIQRYLAGSKRRPLVVHAEAGTGKSAVLARAVASVEAAPGETLLVHRFIGATTRSSHGDRLLSGLCTELQRGLGIDAHELPTGVRELGDHLDGVLLSASEKRPVVLVVDALDQLAAGDEARNLAWVPSKLPPHVHVVLSTLPGETLDQLRRRLPHDCFLELGPMAITEGARLLDAWLEVARRTLTPEQRRAVLSDFAASGRPLHLRLAFEEVRRWRSGDPPAALGRDVDSVVRRLFKRLARDSNFGPMLVARSLAYLVSSREGLSEAEMVDLLSRDPAVLNDFCRLSPAAPAVERLPPAVWSRYYHELSDYLTERGGPGLRLLGFFHRQLAEVVEADYLRGRSRRDRHRQLAEYFARRPTCPDPAEPDELDVRKLEELPYHECHGERWRELGATLTNPEFVEAKLRASGPQALIQDYELGLSHGLGSTRGTRRLRPAVEAVHAALGAGAHRLAEDPRQLWPQLFGQLQAERTPAVERFLADARLLPSGPWLCPLTASLRPSAGLVRTISAHVAMVLRVAVSADGRLAASAAHGESEVKVWAPMWGQLVATIRGGKAFAVSPDGSRLLIGASNGSVEVRDSKGGQLLRARSVGRKAVTALALARHGDVVFSGHAHGSIRRWDLLTDEVLEVRPSTKWAVAAIASSAEGNRVIALLRGPAPQLLLWDADHGLRPLDNPGHEDAVNALALSSDGRRALTGAASGDDTVLLWAVDDGRILGVLRHRGPIRSVGFLPRGRALSASGSPSDSTVRIWNLASGREETRLAGHTQGVNDVAAAADGQVLLSAAGDGTLKLWNASPANSGPGRVGHLGPVNDVAITPDGRHAVTASGDGCLKWWDIVTGKPLRTVRWRNPVDGAIAMRVAISPDGRWGASVGLSEPIRIWEVGGRVKHRLEAEPVMWDWVDDLVFHPASERLFSAGNDGFVHAWDVARGTELWRAGDPHDEATALAVTPDGAWVIGGAASRTVTVWDGTVTVWDALSGEELDVVKVSSPVTALAVTPDGATLASFADGLTLWTLCRGDACDHRLIRLLGDEDHVGSHITIAPHGRWAVSSGGALRVWDLRTRDVVARFAGDGEIGRCAIGGDGDTIVCGEETGRVHFLRLQNAALSSAPTR